MTKEERSEDLNPRNKDLDEKIRQLMDPAVPDAPAVSKETPKSKIEKVDSTPLIADQSATNNSPETEVLPKVLSRKVIVPINHDETDEPAEETNNEASNEAVTPDGPVEAIEEKPTVKIDVNHAEDTPEDVAEKLDAAIGKLETAQDEKEKAKGWDDAEVPSHEDEQEDQAETGEGEEESDEESTAPLLDNPVEDLDDDTAVENELPVVKKLSKTKPSSKKPLEAVEDEPLPKAKVVEDPATDKIVKEIVVAESDTLLKVEDELKAEDDKKLTPKSSSPLRILFTKTALKLYLFLLLVGLVGLGIYPVTRYKALNAAGIKSSSSLTVLDGTTQLPLKNVTVTIAGVTSKTSEAGTVQLSGLPLGPTFLKIERTAFSKVETTITLGWGSNPLGDFNLTPQGERYKIELTDVLSGRPVAGAQADSAEVAGQSDDKGVLILTVPQTDKTTIEVVVRASNYRDETITINLTDKKDRKLKLVPARKHVFVSKRSGKFDIYSVYVDGKDEKLLLAGSGNEKDDLVLLPHASSDNVAYVSTRAGKAGTAGNLLSDLVLLEGQTGRTSPVATAERIQIIGWSGNRLVFVAVSSGQAGGTNQRNKLMSYSVDEGKTIELASSNYFNDLLMVKGLIYFAPSSAVAGGDPPELFVVEAGGGNKKSLFQSEVWKIIRTAYDQLNVSVGTDWYGYTLGGTEVKKLDNAPANKLSRLYFDSPSGTKSAWIDVRDGKGTLLIHDVAANKETTLLARSGLTRPVVWLDENTLIFRVESQDETADYVISLSGGSAVKVRDVTKTAGIDNWYYY